MSTFLVMRYVNHGESGDIKYETPDKRFTGRHSVELPARSSVIDARRTWLANLLIRMFSSLSSSSALVGGLAKICSFTTNRRRQMEQVFVLSADDIERALSAHGWSNDARDPENESGEYLFVRIPLPNLYGVREKTQALLRESLRKVLSEKLPGGVEDIVDTLMSTTRDS